MVELNVPRPGPGQVLLRVLSCGICRTDLHTAEGDIPLKKTPVIPGHQIVGVVEELGPGVKGVAAGDRLGVAWLHWTCGKCRFCRRGDENLCENAKFTGYDADGGYAEFALAEADFCYRIPDVFNPVEAAPLLCAGIIGYRSLRLSDAAPGEVLALYGFGASAHVCIQVAVHKGIKVVVFSRDPEHRRLALQLGAVWAGEVSEPPALKPDRAVIFAPAGVLVRHALELVDKGGTVALAGIYMDTIPELDYDRHLYNEKKLKSVTAATRQDGIDLMREAGEVPVKTETETFSLEEANKALQLVKQSRIKGAGVITFA
ncbi:MAG: zinc-dependent alcohol dehydrogenase family protein [Candidatus Eisenbacteria bacterium]|nr:zinc-dependent alcohol dehydrogenase family protein [Candidatus Eisenbacteria bacterium]